jgi:nicotinate-nucleotide adenylyltransferase
MPILYFGGSFNPIHHGHLIASCAAAEAGGFDGVTLIPSHQPPHKPAGLDMASPNQRLAMCELAAQGVAGFQVDALELSRSGPSYTIDTARTLARRDGQKVHWLIGTDMLLHLPKWHEPEALLAEVSFVIVARPGWQFDWQSMPPAFRHLAGQVVETPLIDISATGIRRRVSAGLGIDYLTPPGVCRYIAEEGLYKQVEL